MRMTYILFILADIRVDSLMKTVICSILVLFIVLQPSCDITHTLLANNEVLEHLLICLLTWFIIKACHISEWEGLVQMC